jgi:hypothetical protein
MIDVQFDPAVCDDDTIEFGSLPKAIRETILSISYHHGVDDWENCRDSNEVTHVSASEDAAEYVIKMDPDPAEGFTYSEVENEVSE